MATKAEIREYFAKFGKQGGKKAARMMTPEQRQESASKAAKARWAKIKAEHDQNMASIDRSLANLDKTGHRIDAAMTKLEAARSKKSKRKSPPPEQ